MRNFRCVSSGYPLFRLGGLWCGQAMCQDDGNKVDYRNKPDDGAEDGLDFAEVPETEAEITKRELWQQLFYFRSPSMSPGLTGVHDLVDSAEAESGLLSDTIAAVFASPTDHLLLGNSEWMAILAGLLGRYPDGSSAHQSLVRLEANGSSEISRITGTVLRLRASKPEEVASILLGDPAAAREAALILLEQAPTIPVHFKAAAEGNPFHLNCLYFALEKNPSKENIQHIVNATSDESLVTSTLAKYLLYRSKHLEFARDFESNLARHLNKRRRYSRHMEFYQSIDRSVIPDIVNQLAGEWVGRFGEWVYRKNGEGYGADYLQGALLLEMKTGGAREGPAAVLCGLLERFNVTSSAPLLRYCIANDFHVLSCADVLGSFFARRPTEENAELFLVSEEVSPAARARILARRQGSRRQSPFRDELLFAGLKTHWTNEWASLPAPQGQYAIPNPLLSYLDGVAGTSHVDTIEFLTERLKKDPLAWPVVEALAPCRNRPLLTGLLKKSFVSDINEQFATGGKQVRYDNPYSRALGIHLGKEVIPFFLQLIADAEDPVRKRLLYASASFLCQPDHWLHAAMARNGIVSGPFQWGYIKYPQYGQYFEKKPDLELRSHLAHSVKEAIVPGLIKEQTSTDPALRDLAENFVKSRSSTHALSPPDPVNTLLDANAGAVDEKE
jgi:hypothetical protein